MIEASSMDKGEKTQLYNSKYSFLWTLTILSFPQILEQNGGYH